MNAEYVPRSESSRMVEKIIKFFCHSQDGSFYRMLQTLKRLIDDEVAAAYVQGRKDLEHEQQQLRELHYPTLPAPLSTLPAELDAKPRASWQITNMQLLDDKS